MNQAGYGADQTGKREWRAWVYHAGKRQWIGCRDHQADALKAAREVWHSLHGDWSGAGTETSRTFRERYNADFLPDAFDRDGDDEIIRGTHGDMRERDDWLVVRFEGFTSAELLTIEATLERDWCGAKKWQDGCLFAVGIGRAFSVAMGELIGAPLKRPTQPTEEIAKLPPKPLATIGLNRNVLGGPVGQHGSNRNAPINGHDCAQCRRPIFNARARFCSSRCKQTAYRERNGAPTRRIEMERQP